MSIAYDFPERPSDSRQKFLFARQFIQCLIELTFQYYIVKSGGRRRRLTVKKLLDWNAKLMALNAKTFGLVMRIIA
jgi:hypothetical protein